MRAKPGQSKPTGFDVLTRIVYVHAAFSLAVLVSALLNAFARGSQIGTASAGVGIVVAVAGFLAMLAVAKRRTLRALALLRLMLWITVAKVLLEMIPLLSGSAAAINKALLPNLLNEAVLVALAVYWSRPIHNSYLTHLKKSYQP